MRRERAGPIAVTGLGGQVGREITERAWQAGMRGLDCLERQDRDRGPAGRQQLPCHCFPGQGMPEAERVALHREQHGADAVL